MRHPAANSGLFPIFAAILICLSARQAAPQEAVSSAAAVSAPTTSTTSLTSTSTTSGTSSISSSSTASTVAPTEQTGTGIFARLPFKLTLSVRVGYDDNVGTSSTGGTQGSGYTSGSLGLTYDFGSPRTRLSLGAGVGGTYYWQSIQGGSNRANDYDITNYLNLSVVHKATPRLTLSETTYLTYQTEPQFNVGAGLNTRSGNYFYTSDRFGAEYLWAPRFSTETDYTLVVLHYDDSSIGEFTDRFENTFGQQFRFALVPTTKLVLDYRLQIISYMHASNRDSVSNYFLAGIDQNFNPRLTGSFRAGAQFIDYEQTGSQSSPYFEGSLNYVVSKRTTIAWTSRYSIEQADISGNQARQTFRTGLTGQYAFTPRISGSIGANYSNDEYQSISFPGGFIPGFNEDTLDLSLSLHYAVTRYFGVEAGYGYTDVSSDDTFREYSRNRYWAGLNVTF